MYLVMSDWNNLKRPLVLASCSPRRRQILADMGFSFSVQEPSVPNESDYLQHDRLEESLKGLATIKARSVSSYSRHACVLGADTIVVIDGEILGKPTDRNDALRMLSMLSGRVHQVYTAVALVCEETGFHGALAARTDVDMRNIPTAEIQEYLDSGEFRDKAGAYAIQGRGMVLVEKINGCFYNVMGLPVIETIKLCGRFTGVSDIN